MRTVSERIQNFNIQETLPRESDVKAEICRMSRSWLTKQWGEERSLQGREQHVQRPAGEMT